VQPASESHAPHPSSVAGGRHARLARRSLAGSSFGALGAVALFCCGRFGTLEGSAGESNDGSPGTVLDPELDAGDPPAPLEDAAVFDGGPDAEPTCVASELPIRCAPALQPGDPGAGECFGTFDGGRGPQYVTALPEGGVALTAAQKGRTGSYWLPWRMPAEGGYWSFDLAIQPGDAGLPADGFGIAFVRREPGGDAGRIPGGLDQGGGSLGLAPLRGFSGSGAILATYLGTSGLGKLDLGFKPLPAGSYESADFTTQVFRVEDGVRIRVRLEPNGPERQSDAGLPVRSLRVVLLRLQGGDPLVGESAFDIPADAELVGISSATGLYFSEHRIERFEICEPAPTDAYQNR